MAEKKLYSPISYLSVTTTKTSDKVKMEERWVIKDVGGGRGCEGEIGGEGGVWRKSRRGGCWRGGCWRGRANEGLCCCGGKVAVLAIYLSFRYLARQSGH